MSHGRTAREGPARDGERRALDARARSSTPGRHAGYPASAHPGREPRALADILPIVMDSIFDRIERAQRGEAPPEIPSKAGQSWPVAGRTSPRPRVVTTEELSRGAPGDA